MKRDQRIENIINRFNDADNEHIAKLAEQAYDPRKQMRVEVVIATTLQGYFEGCNVEAVLSSSDIQIRLDELLRDVALLTAKREYAIEVSDMPEQEEVMTDQQAAEDAAADYHTEQQQNRIERCANN